MAVSEIRVRMGVLLLCEVGIVKIARLGVWIAMFRDTPRSFSCLLVASFGFAILKSLIGGESWGKVVNRRGELG
jgi:hypothetical protein